MNTEVIQKSYSEKLLDPRWQRKRLEIFQRDNWTCQSCNRIDSTLHIHHIKYLPNIEPWDYDNSFLITYCHRCHETEHLIGNQIDEIFQELISTEKIFIKPLAQINNLIENYPPFHDLLKDFLNNCTIQYLKYKEHQTI